MSKAWVISNRWKFEVKDLPNGMIQVCLNDATYSMTREEFKLFSSVIDDYNQQEARQTLFDAMEGDWK